MQKEVRSRNVLINFSSNIDWKEVAVMDECLAFILLIQKVLGSNHGHGGVEKGRWCWGGCPTTIVPVLH